MIKNTMVRKCWQLCLLSSYLFLCEELCAQTHVFAQLNGSPVKTSGWNLIGAAAIGNITGTGNSEVIVCPVGGFLSGAVFYKEPINLSFCNKWIAEFDFRIYDGSMADGLAFCFLDVPPVGLVVGGGMGIPATANGLKICFDPNPNCFPLVFGNYPKIEMRWGAGYNECWVQPTADNSTGTLSFIRSNNYVHAKIVYNNGNISVFLNNTLYLTGYQQFNFTGYLGFTAATGAKTDNHSVKNVVIYTSMPSSEAGADTSICSGQTVQLGTTPAAGLLYNWTPSTGLSSSTISNPVVTPTNTLPSKSSYTYFVKTSYDTAAGCTSLDSITITVSPAAVIASGIVNASMCQGRGYLLPSGKPVLSPGLYKDTLKSKTGCDSIIQTVNVTALSPVILSVDTTIVAGNIYTLPSGNIVNAAGTYTDTVLTRAGCDSLIVTTRLSIVSNCIVHLNQRDSAVCPGAVIHLAANLSMPGQTCGTYTLSDALQKDLVGWYPFCGSTKDIGPQHNNGIGMGPLTYGPDRYNNANTAVKFTGNNESIVTRKIERTTSNSFSYVTWVNTSNRVTLPAETLDPLSGFRTDLASTCVIHATHGYNWNTDKSATGAGLYVSTNGVFVLEHTDVIIPTPLVWQGNLTGWHCVALVYDNHLPKLYIDGKFVRSGLKTPYTVHPSFGCDSVFLNGRYLYPNAGFGKGFNPSGNFVPSNNFKGAIDDIKIYSRALNPDEIIELYKKDVITLLWNTGDTTQTISAKPNQTTRYWVRASYGATTCSDSSLVTVVPAPTVFLGNDTSLCEKTTLLLQAPTGTGYSYTWQDNSSQVNFNVAQEGRYFVKVANQLGCTASDTINVVYKTLPVFNLGNDTSICKNQLLHLNPSLPLGTYLWNTGGSSGSIDISMPGLYWLQVSNAGCKFTDSIAVASKAGPKVNIGSDTVLCKGNNLLLDATNNNASYLWQDGSTFPTYTVVKAGSYSVKVSKEGCDTTVGLVVRYQAPPLIHLAADTVICSGKQLLLDVTYPSSSYKWQDGSHNPTFLVNKAGMYTVNVSNTCGSSTAQSMVKYKDCACELYVPNAFTPNSDGKNDLFRPSGKCVYNNFEMAIYNRWGQLIYRTTDASAGWDGTLNGYEQPKDTYVWLISYTDQLSGEMYHRKGTVVLVK